MINQANRELDWSPNPQDLKLIFIAGNEIFTQQRRATTASGSLDDAILQAVRKQAIGQGYSIL